MSTVQVPTGVGAEGGPSSREIVAIVLERYGRIALFKGSRAVHHDCGLWHCITGYLDPGVSPRQQALTELQEETGLTPADLSVLEPCRPLILADKHGDPWLVHLFRAITSRRRLRTNEEHEAYRWTSFGKVARFANRVQWLDVVLEAAVLQGQDQQVETAAGVSIPPNRPHSR